VLLLFLGVFSSSNTARKSTVGRRPGTPDLGRKVTPGQHATGQTGSVTPLLNARPSNHRPRAARTSPLKKSQNGATDSVASCSAAKACDHLLGPRNAGPTPWVKLTFQMLYRTSEVLALRAHQGSQRRMIFGNLRCVRTKRPKQWNKF